MAAQIRPAVPGDAAILALLGRVTFAETFAHLFRHHAVDLRTYLDTTFDVAKIERSVGKLENSWWLASVNRLPVGYAKLKHPAAPPAQPYRQAAQLQKLYVLGAFLGTKIGHALMAEVSRAAGQRAPLLWLDVLRDNHRAISFYEKQHFATIGDDRYTIGAQSFAFQVMARPA